MQDSFIVLIVLSIFYLIFNGICCFILNSILDKELDYQESIVYFYTGISILGLIILTTII